MRVSKVNYPKMALFQVSFRQHVWTHGSGDFSASGNHISDFSGYRISIIYPDHMHHGLFLEAIRAELFPVSMECESPRSSCTLRWANMAMETPLELAAWYEHGNPSGFNGRAIHGWFYIAVLDSRRVQNMFDSFWFSKDCSRESPFFSFPL